MLLVGWVMLAALGCSSEKGSSSQGGTDEGAEAPVDATDGEPEPSELSSSKSKLKAKNGAVYARHLSQALGLERNEVCRELGLYDCSEDVHRIALGGVEPYQLSIRAPLPVAPLTGPIALDRVALAACTRRAELDFAAAPGGAPGGIFSPVVKAPGDANARRTVATSLIEALLGRRVEPGEVDEIVSFYDEIEGLERDREWAAGACFALATHVEALFY
jgi:hypothetical protein